MSIAISTLLAAMDSGLVVAVTGGQVRGTLLAPTGAGILSRWHSVQKRPRP
jgi:hypothetical protein